MYIGSPFYGCFQAGNPTQNGAKQDLPIHFEPFIATREAIFKHHRLRGLHREADGGIGRNTVTDFADK